jgi:hypothetical protein
MLVPASDYMFVSNRAVNPSQDKMLPDLVDYAEVWVETMIGIQRASGFVVERAEFSPADRELAGD